jgi:DNA-binding LytR/AlgR family response regulator
VRVKIIENNNLNEDLVTIECKEITQTILNVANYIENYGLNIIGKLNGERYFVSLNDIYYFEAVDNKVFAYTKSEVYEVNYKIHEINDLFSNTFFVQISRTVILNIDKINRVSTLVNGRILAVLNNKEKQIITRAYAHEFKQKLLTKGDSNNE